MIRAFLVAILISLTATAATSTKVLALRLWDAIEKEQNLSYTALDNYRIRLDAANPVKAKLDDPQEFKRYQTIIRNNFIEKVSTEFSRNEIMNLIKIYKRPEMSKLRLFNMDFWDSKNVSVILETNSGK
jgi:hypothetical protein